MAQRRFGPVLGAGTVVIEREGQKQISPSQLGTTLYVGILEKGQTDEVITCLGRGQMDRKVGGRIADSLVPDAGQDFFSLAAGAGEMNFVRITDGSDTQAERTFYTRHDDANPGAGSFFNGASASVRAQGKSTGRWAGKAFLLTKSIATAAVTATTVDFAQAMAVDFFKGATLWAENPATPGTQVGPYVCTGNTAAGIVSFESHNDIATDWPADPSIAFLELTNEEKHVAILFGDGVENPATEFSMVVLVDGEEVSTYPNLSMDPTSGRYIENIVNFDTSNEEVEVGVEWTGGVTALARPTNCWRGESSALVDPGDSDPDLLTAIVTTSTPDPGNTGDGTGAVTAFASDYIADTITVECTTIGGAGVAKFKYTSLIYGTSADDVITDGTPFAIGARGVTVDMNYVSVDWALADKVVLQVARLGINDELVGGYLYPDIDGSPTDKYRIIGNSGETVRVAVGSDLTSSASPGDTFSVEAPQELEMGSDGVGGLATNVTPFLVAFDTGTSPINALRGQGKGLVKMATPGLANSLVDKAGLTYGESRAYQYRVEVSSNIVDEVSADTYVNTTVGKNDFGVTTFPSFAYVVDPDSTDGALKLVSTAGMIHGREARVAADYEGYHKAEAGLTVTYPRIVALPTEAPLNEEFLNPRGINIIKKVQGNFVGWGDRTIASDPTWKWKHQREQMSHYILSLLESFDWLIWSINDPETWQLAYTALYSFFLPEWRKRALRGNTFEDAASIKVDNDINTDATMATGDLNAEVSLRLADTVERFKIGIGKKGLFEEAA